MMPRDEWLEPFPLVFESPKAVLTAEPYLFEGVNFAKWPEVGSTVATWTQRIDQPGRSLALILWARRAYPQWLIKDEWHQEVSPSQALLALMYTWTFRRMENSL